MSDAPYRLFDYYRYDDRALFFGREEEVARMVGDILSARLLVLFAPSGSGKSSLLRAGVQPALEKRNFDAVFTRVGENPIKSIITALQQSPNTAAPWGNDLVTALKGRAKPAIVVIDQFEELFLQFSPDSEIRKEFPKELARALYDSSLRVYFVLSLRSDYFVFLNEFREAIPAIFYNNANLELRPFDDAAARSAIVGPSELEGSTFTWEKGLPERVINDLKSEVINERRNGVLPITLQIVCHTLWAGLKAGIGEITAASYDAHGGAAEIIKRRIFEPIEATRGNDRRLLCRLFRELITKEGTKRIMPMSRLHKALGERQKKRTEAMIDRFDAALLLRKETARGETWVELRHDFLAFKIRPWIDTEERRLESKRRRDNVIAGVAGIALTVLAGWLWINFHRYTAELGSPALGFKAAPADQLTVTRKLHLGPLRPWPLRLETGFSRQQLREAGATYYAFDLPDALTDWSAVTDHLTPSARDRLLLATRLDAFRASPEAGAAGSTAPALSASSPRPDFALLRSSLINDYAAVDGRVIGFAADALENGNDALVQSNGLAVLGQQAADIPQAYLKRTVAALLVAADRKNFPDRKNVFAVIANIGARLPAEDDPAIHKCLLQAMAPPAAKPELPKEFRALQQLLAKPSKDGAETRAAPEGAAQASASKDEETRESDTAKAAAAEQAQAAAFALGQLAVRLPADRAAPFIQSALAAFKGENKDVSVPAENGLESIGRKTPDTSVRTIVAGFIEALKSSNADITHGAARALGQIHEFLPAEQRDAAIAALSNALESSSLETKGAAAISLSRLREKLPADRIAVVTGVLLELLNDPKYEFKFAVLQALADFSRDLSTGQLDRLTDFTIRLVSNKIPGASDSYEMDAMLQCLGEKLLPPRADDAILHALLDSVHGADEDTRKTAAGALSRLAGAALPDGRGEAFVLAVVGLVAEQGPDSKSEVASALSDYAFDASKKSQFVKNYHAGQPDVIISVLQSLLKGTKDSSYSAAARIGMVITLADKLPPDKADAFWSILRGALRDPASAASANVANTLRNLADVIPDSVIVPLAEDFTNVMTTAKGGNDSFRSYEAVSSAGAALGALAKRLPPERVDAAIKFMLESKNTFIHDSATLAQLAAASPTTARKREVMSVLLETAKKEDPDTRFTQISGISALGELAAESSGEVATEIGASLLDMLTDATDSELVQATVEAVAKAKAPLSAAQCRRAMLLLARCAAVDSPSDGAGRGSASSRMRSDQQQAMRSLIRTATRIFARGDNTDSSDSLIDNLTSAASEERTLAICLLPHRALTEQQLIRIRELRDDSEGRPWVRMAALETLVSITREKALAKAEAEEKARGEKESKADAP